MTLKFETREAWLIGALEGLTPLFQGEVDTPEIRVSVGFPGGKANRRKTIGQCWPVEATNDGVVQIFVSPIIEDAVEVLSILAHEMIHAILGAGFGHKKEFIKLAKLVGLLPKWTATTAGPELRAALVTLADELGEFPHSGLKQAALAEAKQGTRMLLVQCPESDYKVRMTAKWIDKVGTPICPCHDLAMDAR